jgi:hypothetical protein
VKHESESETSDEDLETEFAGIDEGFFNTTNQSSRWSSDIYGMDDATWIDECHLQHNSSKILNSISRFRLTWHKLANENIVRFEFFLYVVLNCETSLHYIYSECIINFNFKALNRDLPENVFLRCCAKKSAECHRNISKEAQKTGNWTKIWFRAGENTKKMYTPILHLIHRQHVFNSH